MTQEQSTFYRRAFGTATAAALGLALFWILEPFAGALLWAGLLALLLFPLNERLCRALRGRRSLAATLLTVGTVIMIVVPTLVLGALFATQAAGLARAAQASAAQHQIQSPGDVANLLDDLTLKVGDWLPIPMEQVRASVLSAGEQLAQWALSFGGMLAASIVNTVVSVIVALFVLFFFLRDGEQMVRRTVALIPLDDRRKTRLVGHLADVTRAVVLGSLVTAAVQGTLVGLGFALAGLASPIVFGVVAVGAALVPMVGTTLVWVPAAIWAGVSGHWGTALFMAVWGVAVVSSADNVVRPLFISSRAKISTLPVFIGLLGGIAAFGPIGIFLGPVVIALALALFEFAEQARAEQG